MSFLKNGVKKRSEVEESRATVNLLLSPQCDTACEPQPEPIMKYGVMTAISRDREGLVAKYTDSLRQWGANLYMGHGQQLGRMFVFDALFQAEDPDLSRIAVEMPEKLRDEAPSLIEVAAPVAYRNPSAQHYTLNHLSEDQVGIVSTLAEKLTIHGASIVDLVSKSYNAAECGANLFSVDMQVDVPNGTAVRNLRQEFSDLEKHKGWEIHFESEPRAGMRVASTAPYPPSGGVKWTPPTPSANPSGERPPAEAPKWAVLSTIGTDRPGIIASTANFLAEHKASIHAQTARRVSELFSSHCLVKASAADMERVKRDYRETLGDFRPTFVEAPPPTPFDDDLLRLDLTVHALDEPGIISGLTAPIASHGASIATLSFGLYPDRRAGSPAGSRALFVVEMSLLVRDANASKHIEAGLLALERDRGWEVDYRPARRTFDTARSEAEDARR